MPEEPNSPPPSMFWSSDPVAIKKFQEVVYFGKISRWYVVGILKTLLTRSNLGRMLTRYDILITPTEVAFMDREENGEDRIVRFEDVPEDKRWQEMLWEYSFGRLPRKKKR